MTAMEERFDCPVHGCNDADEPILLHIIQELYADVGVAEQEYLLET
jgi:hypothetical protein